MDWSSSDMDRLFELYQKHFSELRQRVTDANRSHGSTRPEKTWMEELDRQEFEILLTNPSEPAVARRWVSRFIRGHENEFPNMRVA